MNKKILSIFVMVMALSLLGVSCNNKNTTGSTDENGGGGSTTTPVSVNKATLLGYVKALGAYTPDGDKQSWDFNGVTDLTASGIKLTATGSEGVSVDTVKGDGTDNSAKKFIVDGLEAKGLIATVTVGGSGSVGSTATIDLTIKIEVKAGSNITLAEDVNDFKTSGSGFIIKLEPSQNWK